MSLIQCGYWEPCHQTAARELLIFAILFPHSSPAVHHVSVRERNIYGAVLSIIHFLETTHLLWYYWIIMEGLQLFPAFWLSMSLAVIICWFPAKQLIGEKCVSKAHKCGYEITQWSSWVHVNLQAVFFSSFPYLWLKWAFGDVTLTDVIFFAVRFAVLQHDNCNIHSKRASPMLWEDHW